MLLIDCPHCGPRDENEFHYGGQAGIACPTHETTDAEWADYVFLRDNPKGWFHERWFHVHGCRTWFDVERHTVTHELRRPATDETRHTVTHEMRRPAVPGTHEIRKAR